MKVLLITPYFDESYHQISASVKLAPALASEMEVVVLSGHTKKEGWEKREWGRIFFVKDSFTWGDPVNQGAPLRIWKYIWRILREEKPDVIAFSMFMFFTASLLPILRLRGWKTVILTDTFVGFNWFPRSLGTRILSRIYFWGFGFWMLQAANRVAVYHSGNLVAAKKLGIDKKTRVLPYPFEGEILEKIGQPKDLKKKRGEIWVSWAGRLAAIKRVDDFLESAQKLAAKHQNLVFIIAGDTKGRKNLVRKYESERIRFLGFRKDILEVLDASDIFVLSSYDEGLPSALMEAMALGKACVASRVGGTCDLIKAGKTGLSFARGNVSQMCTQIEKLAQDKKLRAEVGKNAREHIAKNYFWAALKPKFKKFLSFK